MDPLQPVWTHLCSFVDIPTLVTVGCVSREQRQWVEDETVWRQHCQRRGFAVLWPQMTCWKEFFTRVVYRGYRALGLWWMGSRPWMGATRPYRGRILRITQDDHRGVMQVQSVRAIGLRSVDRNQRFRYRISQHLLLVLQDSHEVRFEQDQLFLPIENTDLGIETEFEMMNVAEGDQAFPSVIEFSNLCLTMFHFLLRDNHLSFKPLDGQSKSIQLAVGSGSIDFVSGLWVGDYGPHGMEILYSIAKQNTIEFIKVLGDINVPCGVPSLLVDLNQPCEGFGGLVQSASQVPLHLRGLQRFQGYLTIAGQFFSNPSQTPVQVVFENSTSVFYYWPVAGWKGLQHLPTL